MKLTTSLVNVFVIPEHNGMKNVIRRVHWMLNFEIDGFCSNAMIETFLDVNNIDSMIPANEIGNDLLLKWAFEAQGGDEFVSKIQTYHEEKIEYQRQCAGQIKYVDGFDLVENKSFEG